MCLEKKREPFHEVALKGRSEKKNERLGEGRHFDCKLQVDWDENVRAVTEDYLIHYGVNITDLQYIFHVAPLEHFALQSDGTLKKIYASGYVVDSAGHWSCEDLSMGGAAIQLLPLQCAVRFPVCDDVRFSFPARVMSIAEQFPLGCSVVITGEGNPYRGNVGQVCELPANEKDTRLGIFIENPRSLGCEVHYASLRISVLC